MNEKGYYFISWLVDKLIPNNTFECCAVKSISVIYICEVNLPNVDRSAKKASSQAYGVFMPPVATVFAMLLSITTAPSCNFKAENRAYDKSAFSCFDI